MNSRRWLWAAVVALLVVQAALMVSVVRRESLTFDEGDHMYSGIHDGAHGRLRAQPGASATGEVVAALPLTGARLWTPPLEGRDFKVEAYMGGRDWVARNDGASGRMVLKMRLAAGFAGAGPGADGFFGNAGVVWNNSGHWWRWCWWFSTRIFWRTPHW